MQESGTADTTNHLRRAGAEMALRRLRGPLLRPICRAQALSSLKPWEALSESERAAWESLGRGESWHRTPQKTLPSWGQLQVRLGGLWSMPTGAREP